ncbi:MAG: GWxTD domain-containing protein, partial [Bacteroidales bacterium]|nr:GWxTD domain-containing protein [Bacteroidales bacterium]
MKRLYFLLLIALLPLISFSQGINALYSFTTYNVPTKVPYVEVNTSIDGNSLSYVKDKDSKEKGLVELTIIIKQDSIVKYVEKRNLRVLKGESNASILDVQRVELENGAYNIFFEIKDRNDTNPALKIEDKFEISYPKNQIAVSGVQIIDSYEKTKIQNARSKNGYDITPYLFDAVPETKNQISYYAEIYNADKEFGLDNYYVISVVLEDIKTGKKYQEIQKIRREKAKEVSIEMGSLDIETLPQGGYFLVVEARNGKNILYAYSKTGFFRYSKIDEKAITAMPQDAFVNTITETDIDDYLYSLTAIASEAQKSHIRNYVIKSKFEEKKYFLYVFFRGINPENPNGEWQYYKEQVDYVNEKYSTPIKKGYQTEMGRVYLQYGKPDILIDEKFKSTSGTRVRSVADQVGNNEAVDYPADGITYMPYQIWKYKKTPFGEVNKGFVFYAPQNNLIEYQLLHSDAKGEPSDRFWEHRLTRNA